MTSIEKLKVGMISVGVFGESARHLSVLVTCPKLPF